MKKLYRCLFLLVILLPLFSCAGRINGSLSADGSAALAVNMSLEPRMTSLIRSLSAAAGQTNAQAAGLVLDGVSIAHSMSFAPGVASVLLRNTAPAAVDGTVQISNINEFLAERGQGFIIFEQGRCQISINRSNGPLILELLSPEISDYLNALMAPIASGEALYKTEYLELVGSFYGRAISDEIAGSRIRASIDFPGAITSVRGGTFSGRRAEFDIPLLDLLVLEMPLVYEVRWN